jgi:ABC-type glutathione transport system ATPase component
LYPYSPQVRRPKAFLEGFQANIHGGIIGIPRGLAFGSPWQVLTAARLCARNQNNGDISSIEEVAENYGVSENLYQPIRTLSGGETVKLALAKAFLYASFSRQLTISSPFSWLSRNNGVYFDKLYSHYVSVGLPLELLALDGEDSIEPHEITESQRENQSPPVDFSVVIRNLTIPLSSSLNPLQSQETKAGVDDLEHELRSPCLIVGENGQGKTLIAKALTGAISIQGTAEVNSKQKTHIHSGHGRSKFKTKNRSGKVVIPGCHNTNPVAVF